MQWLEKIVQNVCKPECFNLVCFQNRFVHAENGKSKWVNHPAKSSKSQMSLSAKGTCFLWHHLSPLGNYS